MMLASAIGDISLQNVPNYAALDELGGPSDIGVDLARADSGHIA